MRGIHTHYLCRLKKAIYGLKQAPLQRLTSFLPCWNLVWLKVRPGFKSVQETQLLWLYVDDIILTGSSTSILDSLTNTLQSEFAMKDLGNG